MCPLSPLNRSSLSLSLSLSLPMHNGNLPFDSLSFSLSVNSFLSLLLLVQPVIWKAEWGDPSFAGVIICSVHKSPLASSSDPRSYISHLRTYLSGFSIADHNGQFFFLLMQPTLFFVRERVAIKPRSRFYSVVFCHATTTR